MSRMTAAHSIDEDVADRGIAVPAEQAAARNCRRAGCSCPSRRAPPWTRPALVGLLAGGLDEPLARTKSRNATAISTIMIGPPTNSASGELPGEQQRQDDAELDDQVGAGDLEGHRGGEAGAACGTATGPAPPRRRSRRTRPRRAPEAMASVSGPVIAQQPDDGLAADHRLDHRRQREAEDQRPGDLPGHRARPGPARARARQALASSVPGAAIVSSWRRQCSSSGCGKPSLSR